MANDEQPVDHAQETPAAPTTRDWAVAAGHRAVAWVRSLTRVQKVLAAAVIVGAVVASSAFLKPSRDERADSAARSACRVFREPFDGTNRKMDALPTEQRIAARHRQLVATTETAATAARLSPRWSVLYDNWLRMVDGGDDPAPVQNLLSECRKALSGRHRTQHDIDCEVARSEDRYMKDCPLA
jgi:hypothetical protein